MQDTARPQTVATFEVLSVIVLALELILVSGFTWDDAISLPIMLWMIFSVTRQRSGLARWLFSAIYAFGFFVSAYLFADGTLEVQSVRWTIWLFLMLGIIQLSLLWAPATSQWIASRAKRADAKATA